MINLQLNRELLDLLPPFLQSQTQLPTFDSKYSILINELWFWQTIIALLYSLFCNRWLPQRLESNSLFLKQFKLVLFGNLVWNIAELVITKMSTNLWELALHHIISVPIFIFGLMEPNVYLG